jgi:hypothetical protein
MASGAMTGGRRQTSHMDFTVIVRRGWPRPAGSGDDDEISGGDAGSVAQ